MLPNTHLQKSNVPKFCTILPSLKFLTYLALPDIDQLVLTGRDTAVIYATMIT